MKSTAILLPIGLAVSAGLSAQAGAHGGSRVYPISEITDAMLAKVELDGLIHEWEDFGEPTMTLTLDFRTYEYSRSPDVSDLDFRIWLGWHDASDRLYLAFVSADDVYHQDDSIWFFFDGDHSGGEGAENSKILRLMMNGKKSSNAPGVLSGLRIRTIPMPAPIRAACPI